ncbi:MAG: dTDP-4-dehydrorhamnose reductase [Bacteroidales bacterium]
MNILITGSNGQLGNELHVCSEHETQNSYFFTDASELDITQKEAVQAFVASHNIGIIINCAAYTAVDKAEDDIERCNLINNIAVRNLAEIAKSNQIFLIHISTDYVFDGSKNIPYHEDDSTSALGVYGKTKLLGEKAIIETGCEYLIFRTSWLYSSYGNNFVKTIQRLSAERESMNVVFDQAGTPTYAADLATFLVHIIESGKYKNKSGIYHFSNEGVCSWYDFALEIVELSGNACTILPCHSDEFPAKVKRPNYSVLDKTKVKSIFNITISHWKDGLIRMINKTH